MNQSQPDTNDSGGRVAIVTGAGSGIGRAAAVALAGAGFRLVLVGRNEAKLTETAALLAPHKTGPAPAPAAPLIIAADLAQPRAAEVIVDHTIETCGRLDLLVNNAAVLHLAAIDRLTEAELRETFSVNVFAPALLVARAWPQFVKQRSGCVINVSSLSAIDPFDRLAAYAASKAALESLTRSILREGRAVASSGGGAGEAKGGGSQRSGGAGIRAFTLTLGAVETEMLRKVVTRDDLPLECTLRPEDVGAVIVECALGQRDGAMGGPIILRSR